MGKNNQKINPAEFMLKKDESSATAQMQKSAPESRPTYRTYSGEARSKKTLIALTPKMFEEAKARACTMGVSFNEYINRLIDADLYGKNDI